MTETDKQQHLLMALFVGVIGLLPFGRMSEIPILILAIWGLIVCIKNFRTMVKTTWFKPFTILFVGYFLIITVSAVDSYWSEKSWLIGVSSWRFYFMGLLVIQLSNQAMLSKTRKWITVLVVFWVFDALLQSVIGVDLFGQVSYPGRLTGVFGQNVKLGPLLALFMPVVMIQACQYKSWVRWLLVALLMLVILLSGTRSAWLMMGFVMVMFWWHHVQGRRLMLLMKTAALALLGLSVLWFASDDFQQRVDRSIQLFQGDSVAIDFALADRLPIWQTAINMYVDHPFNGVGARAFRMAYKDYAPQDDVWVAQQGGGLHAHHWVLELLAETGTIGTLLMLFILVYMFKYAHSRFQQDEVWPYGVSLMAALLPVVSLYSLFSSFWSICLWWLLIMFMAGLKNE